MQLNFSFLGKNYNFNFDFFLFSIALCLVWTEEKGKKKDKLNPFRYLDSMIVKKMN